MTLQRTTTGEYIEAIKPTGTAAIAWELLAALNLTHRPEETRLRNELRRFIYEKARREGGHR